MLKALDWGELPTAFLAETLNWYVKPAVTPVFVYDNVEIPFVTRLHVDVPLSQ
jgi:hypothetical protein